MKILNQKQKEQIIGKCYGYYDYDKKLIKNIAKKKIKDLTYEETCKICNNGGKYLPCDRCPLSFGRNTAICYRHVLQTIHEKKFNLDKEVEINEN